MCAMTGFQYYGRYDVTSGSNPRLTLPSTVFHDPRDPPLSKRITYQLYWDQDLNGALILAEINTTKWRSQWQPRFRSVQDGISRAEKSVGDGRLTLPKTVLKDDGSDRIEARGGSDVAFVKRGQTLHVISDNDLLDKVNHIYLLDENRFDSLINDGWRPVLPIDKGRMNDDDYRRDVRTLYDIENYTFGNGPVDLEADETGSDGPHTEQIKVTSLGSAQDGGIPHLDCDCVTCSSHRSGGDQPRRINSLLLELVGYGDQILFEATPDIRTQIRTTPDHIFLSHDHSGHISGLLAFAIESVNVSDIPVHVSQEMADLLGSDGPFHRLIENRNISLDVVSEDHSLELANVQINVTSLSYDWGQTDPLAYLIEGPNRDLAYLPDVMEWSDEAINLVEDADVAIVDGLIWNKNDIKGDDVPHVGIERTLAVFESHDINADVYFTNLNHTNSVLYDDKKRANLKQQGYYVIERDLQFPI